MKKIKIFSLALALVLSLVLLLSGCNLLKPAYEGKSKTFTNDELEITLTDSFFESENEDREFFYLSTSCGATGFKEHKSDLFTTSGTVRDYANLMKQANSSMNPSEVKTENGLVYIECTKLDDDGEEWTYFLTFLQDGDYFWTIQFHCLSEEYEAFKPHFFTWANSISFK
ncbi:MAG: hypothetical protein IJ400_05205 [Clostridia bacterium]|nr:hypothetical protein [Clostridia bacterium]